jgi:hypothetical protein
MPTIDAVQLDSILSPTRQLEAMIDGNDLQLSKFYFTVLQLLRTAAEWIRESMEDLRRTVDDMERLYLVQTVDQGATFLPEGSDREVRDAAVAMFKQNWESVLAEQNRLGSALLTRIATKQVETKSLRDGVSEIR